MVGLGRLVVFCTRWRTSVHKTASLVIHLLFLKMRFLLITRASPSKNENVIARLVFGESEQVRALSCSPSWEDSQACFCPSREALVLVLGSETFLAGDFRSIRRWQRDGVQKQALVAKIMDKELSYYHGWESTTSFPLFSLPVAIFLKECLHIFVHWNELLNLLRK